MATKVETLNAPHGTNSEPPSPKTDGSARSLPKKPRGEGLTITIDFKDHIELLEAVRFTAKADDREPSKWLRRRLVQLADAGILFENRDDSPIDSDDITGE